MRYALYLLLGMAIAAVVHAIVADNIADAAIWAFGVIMVALLIKVESRERDNE